LDPQSAHAPGSGSSGQLEATDIRTRERVPILSLVSNNRLLVYTLQAYERAGIGISFLHGTPFSCAVSHAGQATAFALGSDVVATDVFATDDGLAGATALKPPRPMIQYFSQDPTE
jgi:hypothetical protein